LGWKQAGPRWEKNRREVDLGRGEEKKEEKGRWTAVAKKKEKRKERVLCRGWNKRTRKEREIGRGSLRVVLGLGLLNFLF
jgi:hypothetical protein